MFMIFAKKSQPLKSEQLQTFADKITEVYNLAHELQNYEPFVKIESDLLQIKNFFNQQEWNLHNDKEYYAENSYFRITCKATNPEFKLQTVRGWTCNEQGECRPKTHFEVNGQVFEPVISNNWMVKDTNFMYKANPMDNEFLMDLTGIPKVLADLIYDYCPDWQMEPSTKLFKDGKPHFSEMTCARIFPMEINLDLEIEQKFISQHISDTLFNYFHSEFKAVETLKNGNSVIVPLKSVKWRCRKKRSSLSNPEEISFSSTGKTVPDDGVVPSMIFRLNLVFQFQTSIGIVELSESVCDTTIIDNIIIQWKNWWNHSSGVNTHILIGCGSKFIQVGGELSKRKTWYWS